MPRRTTIILATLLCVHVSSFSQKISIAYKDYKIEKQESIDSSVYWMLSSYKGSTDSIMNKVIGFSMRSLFRKQPESELGNFLTDCMKEMAEKKFGKKVDAAFLNYSGIRSFIPKGDVSIGKIFEIMPFDNLIVLQDIRGNVLMQFLAKIADKGGWPISGITMKITDKKASNVMIGGKPLDEQAIYTIANVDYIANGGSECDMLRGIPQLNKGYVYRDALIAYIGQITKEGKPIEAKVEGRLTY
jgi:2',3'-cyclic-nucleotide 2'-phosphodiesterase (5'-nucleotidase family)